MNMCIYIYIYVRVYMCAYMCICIHIYVSSWAAFLHINMFDEIIKTHFIHIILLRSFQVS